MVDYISYADVGGFCLAFKKVGLKSDIYLCL